MKKLLLIGSVLSMVTTSAMASQARLLALGMKEIDNDGMYHVSDARNMFLNPAYVNIYNNFVITEYGQHGFKVSQSTTGAIASNATVDSASTPKGQGGFITKSGDMVYGLYYGNESNTSALLRVLGTSAASALNQAPAGTSVMLNSTDNQFDLFYGGEASALKWGANLTYGAGKEDARKAKDTALAMRSGLIGSNWDAHLNVSLASRAESQESITLTPTTQVVKQEFKGKMGFSIGGSYVYSGNSRIFGNVKHYSWEQMDDFNSYTVGGTLGATVIGGQKGTVKGDFTSFNLGWGNQYEVNKSDKIFVSVNVKNTKVNAKFATAAKVSTTVLPVTIAYEAVAYDWLTFRGSVVQNIWGTRDNQNFNSVNAVARSLVVANFGSQGKGSVAASTEVNAGATMTFGKLNIDGLVGAKATGSVQTDSLLTRAAVSYNF